MQVEQQQYPYQNSRKPGPSNPGGGGLNSRKEVGTAIRSFDSFASERRLFKTLPLSVLKDSVLGIDADYFVSRSLNGHSKREPLIHAIGGFPCSVEASLDTLLSTLSNHNIKPLFVLTGIEQPQQHNQNNENSEPARKFNEEVRAQRAQAWSMYDRGQGEQAVMAFDDADPFDIRKAAGGRRTFIKLLNSRGIEYMIAPYRSGAQLSYMASKGYIDAVYGSSDALLYGLERLITAMDYRNTNNNTNNNSGGSFQWISRRAVSSELGFSGGNIHLDQQQFVEAAIAASSFPPVEHMVQTQPAMGPPMTALRAVQDLTGAHGSVYAAVMAYPDTDGYAERFRKACAATIFQPVLKDDGHVEPDLKEDDDAKEEDEENKLEIPNDVHDLVGKRLPDEHMFYLSKGIIGVELLNALASGVYVEDAPLDGGENVDYRNFVLGLQKVRSKALNLLTQTMHRYFQYNQVKLVYWFDSRSEKTFDKVSPPVYVGVSKNKIIEFANKEDILTGLLKGLGENTVKFSEEKKIEFTSDSDILANTFYRALQVLGFIESKSLTSSGKALVEAVNKTPDLSSEIIIAVLLIQSGIFGKSSVVADNIGLIARIGTLINLRHKPIGFTGPLSRNLLSFHSFVVSELQTCRWAIETTLVSLLCNEEADRVSRSDEDWAKLSQKLPFSLVPNAATGIAIKSYLDEVEHSGGDKASAKDSVSSMFKHAVDVVGDIENGFRLWDSVMVVVNSLGKSSVPGYQQFVDADEWLKTRR